MPSPDISSDFVPSDAGSPLLPWEDIHPLLLPTRSPVRDENIAALLSASSYHPPEQSDYQPDQTHVQLYGGLLLDTSSSREEVQMDAANNRHVSLVQEPSKRRRTRREPSPNNYNDPSSSKKRGRPRKTVNHRTGKDYDERRRLQIRLAQRAYRSRKEASMSSLHSRIAHLEAIIEKMSGAVVSFNDRLVQAGALESDSGLAGYWRDTVQTCLSLAKEESTGKKGESENESLEDTTSFPSEETPSPSMSLRIGLQQSPHGQLPIDPALDGSHGALDISNTEATPQDPDSLEISIMELSAFIERLHVACLYEGYLMLCDPSVDLDNLQKPFRFLLSIMDRKRATSYFKARLHARFGRKSQQDEWEEIPFFSIGGAGTHYPRKWRQSSMAVEDPLSWFSQDTRQELDGEWFDIQDLEGYLREKGVSIIARSADDSSKLESSSAQVVDAAGLIPGLLKTGVCLGKTPGFRREDVERALNVAMCTRSVTS